MYPRDTNQRHLLAVRNLVLENSKIKLIYVSTAVTSYYMTANKAATYVKLML